ncbi:MULTISPECIES: ECF transporter S component [unclassified Granulicatella]|uniref:ECF transporter S component n=1 Tax=unclassified Granulicatella TaxID=2630493 RepID=UPI001073A99E|nr:ECF transporter S component [Granulicatella sp. WM01]MBF0780038.1 ECF transporter S component [Granulicatella sp. 19428wC4_WM01]TFU95887.1 ECF transporter S component [Granulicatella sp. WM01]
MRVKQLTTVAILAALSIIISFFSFPIIPSATFLKLDFSDIFTFLALYFIGWKGLILSTFSKGIILYLHSSDPIGALLNVIAALVFNSVYYIVHKKTKKYVISGVVATSIFSVTLSLLNYFVFLPLYMALFNIQLGALDTLVLYAVFPFNIIKGITLSILDSVLIKKFISLGYSKGSFER